MASTPAKIITTFNEKGGSGKTTLSCQIANTLGRRGFSVLLADLDTQQTSVTWSASGQGDSAFKASVWAGAAYGGKVIGEVAKFREKFDFIVADCAPSVDQPTTWGMLLVSDLALIPTRLSPPDLAALKAAKRLAQRALEELGPQGRFPVRVVANGVRKHLEEDRDYLKLLKADKEFPPLEETLGDRRAYQRSMIFGSSVHAVPGSKDAVAEVEALTDRVLQLLGMGRTTLKKAVNA
jgi:chromosome partitioning protein